MKKPIEPEMWERQPDLDTEESWAAFLEFRNQRPPRKLLRKGGIGTQDQRRIWYNDHMWRERAAEYDNSLERIAKDTRDDMMRQTVEDVTCDLLQIMKTLRDVYGNEADKLARYSESTDMPVFSRPQDIAKGLEIVVKSERLLRGESTEKIDTGNDLSHLSLEDVRRINAIASKG